MVKRPKSPDAADDAKYLVIYKPYPEGADLEVEDDCIALVQWMAACIGSTPLMAVHYKPKSRGMVLVEIDKAYAHYNRILGEHTWSNFIKDLKSDEPFKKSQIFFSIYDTGRAAQKEGWKRIHIKNSWFTAPSKCQFIEPYPETTYCDPPPEEPTNKRLCRYLPGYIKPPPPKKVAPKPGSDAWVAQKSDTTSVNVNVEPKKNNRKGKNKKAQTPVSPVSPNAWNQPILSQQPSSSTPFSSNAVPRAPTVTVVPPPLVPPGLSHPIPASVANRSPWGTTPSITRQPLLVNVNTPKGDDGDSSDEEGKFLPNMADIKVLSERSIARISVSEEGGVPFENLWENHEETQNETSQRMICTVHKRKCALTCIDFSRQVKAKRREEAAAKGLDNGKQGRNRFRGRNNGGPGRSHSRSEQSYEDKDKSDAESKDEPESDDADAKSAEGGWSTYQGRSRGNRPRGRGRGGRGGANRPVVDAPIGRMRAFDDDDDA